ncbi:MAG: DUF402 domain-containing protein [Chloroflexota bacterium]
MSFTIYKLNHLGQEELQYTGEVVAQGNDFICVRAIWQPKTLDLGYIVFKQGDVFIEWFYTNRWYNVFKIEDVDSGMCKGYYCNLTRPAIITETSVSSDDLALDIFVTSSGDILRLDDDEYDALNLPAHERQQVEQAVREITTLVQKRQSPFNDLASTND